MPMPSRPPEPGFADAADRAACAAAIRAGSLSFHAASRLLPGPVREPALALYAFCRLSDDAVDLKGGNAAAVASLHRRLDRIYAGRPGNAAADRALADTVHSFALPRALSDALLEGLAWDAAGRRYDTLDELADYAVRVAGAVGAMMALLMRVRRPDLLARAADLGVAMQYTNIARDVGEDARNGRLYLPRDWLAEAGIDPDRLLGEPRWQPALGGVVRRLLDEADRLYARADTGIGRLPPACRPAIHAARLIYAEIGREVARAGHDSVTRRAVVPGRRKLALAARALARSVVPHGSAAAPVLPQAAFLLQAVAAATPPPEPRQAPWQRVDDGAGRVLDLFRRLEERGRAGRRPQPARLHA